MKTKIKLNKEQKKMMETLIKDIKIANENFKNTKKYINLQNEIKKEQEWWVNDFLSSLGYIITKDSITKGNITIKGVIKNDK